MFKRNQESYEQSNAVNLDARIFMETQEDFVFHKDMDPKRDFELFQEECGPLLDEWIEVERILR